MSHTGPDPLSGFGARARGWFEAAFEAPTPSQAQAWAAIASAQHTLVVAPTGSGKTLAAFLWALDRLATEPPAVGVSRTRVLYISPLKALGVDVERNLRAPLTGMAAIPPRPGTDLDDWPDMREITVGIRSGDTPADERRRLARTPPDILITTPESLYLMLTSKMRDTLRGVDTVIVDEVHAVAGGKRGAHLSISLERLDELLDQPAQRIGLSATVRPVEEVARFLGGTHDVTVVRPPSDKPIELQVVVPVEDLAAIDEAPTTPGSSTGAPVRASVWPHVEERILDLVCSHRSTIVFANSRRLAERLCARLNELHTERVTGLTLPAEGSLAPAVVMASGSSRGADPGLEIARAHHGSVSREQRARIEDDLKSGRLPAVVATSSLELGIDMGAVDLVIQVEAPPSVASGLQRVGRAEHRVDGVSRGIVFPKHRGDLVNTAVVAERMRSGAIEELFVPRHPLDVLAQQIVAMVAMDDWDVDAIGAVVRRAAPFSALPSSALDAVLDMLSGRYPSDAFAELRPRLVWDREANTLTARPGSQRLAVVNGGTIPDRGQYGVFLATGDGPGRRVGELDEEMVYESRIGDVFALGATSWRIDDITHDRVLVTPATGQPGRLPFWHGDTIGRPAELGRAIGAFIRDVGTTPRDKTEARLLDTGLDLWATSNLLAYLDEQRDATSHLPDDRTIVVERFRDEIGDWRIAVHSPLGGRVHTPWALAMSRRIHDELGIDVQVMPSDDGIVLRLPDVEIGLNEAPNVLPYLALDPDDVQRAVTEAVAGSALFAARFRECAARSLLLPRRRPDRRTPLWQQRQRAAQLLGVASEHATFPIVLETMREVVQDVFDVPALTDLMTRIASGEVRVVEVETATPSPFARSLLFGYVGAFLYEGDAPLAERRAQALALDPSLLAELLGQAELRELLDADALDQVERELQRLTPERAARDLEDVADLLRVLGPLTGDELATRGCADAWVDELMAARRAVVVRIDGRPWFAGVEDVGRLRDALGAAPPMGVSAAFLEPVADPVGDLVSRYARTHGPFTPQSVADRFGLGVAVVTTTLQRLAVTGRVVSGEFRPQGTGLEWCDTQVLRLVRRRSLAALRREAEPVAAQALGRFLPQWQGIGGRSRLMGVEGLLATVEQLRGALVPASVLERMVLPARVSGYSPALLDELTTSGEVIWSGHGGLPGGDGWVTLHLADDADLLLAQPEALDTLDPAAQTVLEALDGGTALFFRDLVARVGLPEPEVAELLWALVWSGWVGNDTFAPVRARLQTAAQRRPPRPSARYARRPGLPRRAAPQGLPGRWARLPERSTDLTRRAHAAASALIERHGVVTRGASVAERTPGGFAATYRVLAAFEEAGRARRGYFVEGLGAAQFAVPGAVDRLRDVASQQEPTALVLAATDPANPYGAALPWPRREGHQPGRKAGAVVVLVDGDLVLYVERGGRSLLSWSDQDAVLTRAVDALAHALREGWLGRLTVERADGDAALSSPLGAALQRAGFHATPRGLRLRA